ncbi:MAG: hypothetical protein AAFV19_24790 [Pseudomonadota bacterium]
MSDAVEVPEGFCLLIAMPTQGTITTAAVKSLISLTQQLRNRGVPFAFETYEFSDIVFSRNQLMSVFLTRKRFTHMLCLDSDMEFRPEVIWRLIGFGADFTATAYPQKHARWGRIRALIEAETAKPEADRANLAEITSRAWIYNHQRSAFGGGAWVPKRRDGFITVPATGTGMMLLSRAVPETMVARGATRPLPAMGALPLHKGLDYHDFFSHLVSPNGQILYGEDQSFCMRWVDQCGGEIWLDTQSWVTHHGSRGVSGRYDVAVAEDFPEITDET